jgi:Ca-activated chloride channel family protein
MKTPIDEIKLTAYALGELDETERRQIESLLVGDEAMRREVEQIRAAAESIADALAGEEGLALTEAQRRAIDRAAAQSPGSPGWRIGPLRISRGAAAALAACVVVAGALALLLPGRPMLRIDESAVKSEPEAAPVSVAVLDAVILEKLAVDTDPMDSRGTTTMSRPVQLELNAPVPVNVQETRRTFADVQRMEAGIDQSLGQSASRSEDRLQHLKQAQDQGGLWGTTQEDAYRIVGVDGLARGAATADPASIAPRNDSIALAVQGGDRMIVLSHKSDSTPPAPMSSPMPADSFGATVAGEPVVVTGPTPMTTAKAAPMPTQLAYDQASAPTRAIREAELGEVAKRQDTDVDHVLDQTRMLARALVPAKEAEPLKPSEKLVAEQDEAQVIRKKLEEIQVGQRVAPEAAQPRGEAYEPIVENPFLPAMRHPLSTFSIDVDSGSYANVRRFLTGGSLPPPNAVRLEEMINYFSYYYEPPADGRPFATHVQTAVCPWDTSHQLVKIGLKGREIDRTRRPRSNLVFLIDVSGSMDSHDKLPLLVSSMKMLTRELGENDKVSMVVYAGSSGLVLPCTSGADQRRILEALDQLKAGGSTNGGEGIQLAYRLAQENFIEGGVNRVILATDGDFNVGVTDRSALIAMIEQYRKTGVFLSVLGFGTGNLKDATMEQLADKGNGQYAYIDSLREGRRVLVEQMSGTLVTIAKDVKIQVEFNPAAVASYRLIGYENRVLAARDFNDDAKDAGEIGAGHTVTALYEIVPVRGDRPAAAVSDAPGATPPGVEIDPLKYQRVPQPAPDPARLTDAARTGELLTVKLRYKLPDQDVSTKIEHAVPDRAVAFADAGKDFQFAAAVASFGMLLRHSRHAGAADYDSIARIAEGAIGDDAQGYRTEFVQLVRKAQQLSGR